MDELVRRLNESLDGLTSAEKEAFVRQIISETRSAVRPGVRYLPPNFYTDEDSGGEDPPRTDRDGNPIIDTEDETTAFVRRPGDGGRRKKNPGDISLPSTKAKLKPAETDTDSSPAKRSRKSTDTQDEVSVVVILILYLTPGTYLLYRTEIRRGSLTRRKHEVLTIRT